MSEDKFNQLAHNIIKELLKWKKDGSEDLWGFLDKVKIDLEEYEILQEKSPNF
jgi:hypothetical protein